MEDSEFMELAVRLAKKAASIGEVPIGAVVVFENEVIGKGFNLRESSQDPTNHAEIIAIREAAKNLGSWRLVDCSIYVTLEPCPMCAGAIVNARINKCVYGANDPKAGAVNSLFELLSDQRLNHRVDEITRCDETRCASLLSDFFRSIRQGRGIPKPNARSDAD